MNPQLIINGYPLLIRHKGVGAYTIRLIKGMLRHAPDISFRVLLPDFLERLVLDIPGEILQIVSGKPPIQRSIAKDIYWNNRIGKVAAQHAPQTIFHSPAEFWSLSRPHQTVLTLHDCIYRRFPRLQGGIVRRWWWFETERYARNATAILTVSKASCIDLIKLAKIPEAKVKILYPWIDADEFRTKAENDAETVRMRYKLPMRFFLYFGGFNINKNVEFLIRAYAEASRCVALPPLVLAGHILDNLRLAVCDVRGAIRQHDLSPEQVITPGFIAEDEIPGLIGAADVVVYPSRFEGFGYPPVEAMAAGKPVLVSDVASLPEVVRNPVSRFSLSNTTELASKLVIATSNPSIFRCELPVEFTSAVGIRCYLSLLGLWE